MPDFGSNPRVAFFIDGFNLYHSVKAAEQLLCNKTLKWLDVHALCNSYLHQIGGHARLTELHYFTAFAEHLRDKSPEKIARHKAFIRALTARKTHVHVGKFSKKKVWSHELERWVSVYEEKETDVAIACKVLAMAMDNELDVAVIMTGDSDFAPVAKTYQERFPSKRILFALPFARATKRLRQLCPESFTISKEAYLKHPLPDRVKLPSGKFVNIPATWQKEAQI
jgi:uncharacterized LabA/DUF88 family protein